MPGELLQRVLTQRVANRGQGGFLQTANVTRTDTREWLIQGQPLQPQRSYTVTINDFLMTGKEQGLSFLNFNTPGVVKLAEKRDIRFAVIQELQSKP